MVVVMMMQKGSSAGASMNRAVIVSPVDSDGGSRVVTATKVMMNIRQRTVSRVGTNRAA